jgi:hypothetical protein
MMIANHDMIFELDESYDLQFDHEFLFERIDLEIGGCCIDILYNEQIKIWNKIYELEVKKIGYKLHFQIPFGKLNKGNGILISECEFKAI